VSFPVELAVRYLDAHCVVLDKAAGMLSVPGRGALAAGSLADRARAAWPDALVVHRLDMATSGLLLLARGADAQRALSRAFAVRTVAKRYVAVVAGLVEADHGSIDLPLAADWPRRPLQKVDAIAGKPSLTHFQVVARDSAARTTRLDLEPVTGRSHQLRVHLLAIGHSIVGDTLYAPPEVRDAAPRLLLHASWLRFPHPVGGEAVEVTSAPPF
jgi:tRNA pseudouridine32 synthase/23S rRNA pseudouridine746 synthase